MLGTVLRHHLGQLVVHVVADTLTSLFLHLVDGTDDLGLDRALRREGLDNRLALEPHSRLGQHRAEHAAGTGPRLSTLFVLHAQHLEALDVGLHPVFARRDVGVDQLDQVTSHHLQRARVHFFGQVGVELTALCGVIWRYGDLHGPVRQGYCIGVVDLDLHIWDVGALFTRQAVWGL